MTLHFLPSCQSVNNWSCCRGLGGTNGSIYVRRHWSHWPLGLAPLCPPQLLAGYSFNSFNHSFLICFLYVFQKPFGQEAVWGSNRAKNKIKSVIFKTITKCIITFFCYESRWSKGANWFLFPRCCILHRNILTPPFLSGFLQIASPMDWPTPANPSLAGVGKV